MSCSVEMRLAGKAYPRTCQDCGLGPCKKGLEVKAPAQRPDANGWMPIETAPEGRCLMWVADFGFGREGEALFGQVWVWPDQRSYRPDNCHGAFDVTHWQPLPKPPVSPSQPISSPSEKTPDDASLPSSGGQSQAGEP